MTTKSKASKAHEENGVVPDFSFGHLQIEERTSEFELPWVAPEAVLIVRPATEANKQFQAGMLRLSGNRQRQLASGGRLTPDDAAKDRDDDRKLYPKYVIVGWRGIFNQHGEAVPFNVDNCIAFVKALPNWIFDKLRIFCMRPEGFIVDDDEVVPDAGDLAPNS